MQRYETVLGNVQQIMPVMASLHMCAVTEKDPAQSEAMESACDLLHQAAWWWLEDILHTVESQKDGFRKKLTGRNLIDPLVLLEEAETILKKILPNADMPFLSSAWHRVSEIRKAYIDYRDHKSRAVATLLQLPFAEREIIAMHLALAA